MGARRATAALLVTLGCSGPAPTPTHDGAAQGGPSAPSGQMAPGPSPEPGSTELVRPQGLPGELWEDVPSDVEAALRVLAEKSKTVLLACQDGPLKGLTAEQATASGYPFDGPALEAACGEAAKLYDDHVALLGKTRSGDNLLSNLARVGDDLDYLRRTMAPDERPPERGNAVNHVRDALRDGLNGVEQLQSGPIWPYHTVGSATPEGWKHTVEGTHDWLVRLKDTLGRLALTQGTNPVMVRKRMLESFFVGAERDGELRAKTLAAIELDPAERAAREAYHALEAAALKALRDTELRYVRGEVTTEAIRTELVTKLDAAMAAYEQAWTAETARLK